MERVMTKRRLMQGMLALALVQLSRSPSGFATLKSHQSEKPLTPGEHLREALVGSGLIPARLAGLAGHKPGAHRRPAGK
jgi:hypothetical protein